MPRERILIFLLLITLISAVLRFYQLGNIPNGLATDEADIGYNAYSIIKTGADVYGRKFPLFFQSLDDYKPGLVFYMEMPAIAVFGLSDFSVRLVPAIIGSIIPILVFVLTRQLYPKDKLLPYLSSVLLAFAPWNIALSRAMIQYIPLILFYLIFLTLFLIAQKEFIVSTTNLFIKIYVRAIILFLSFIFLALTLYIYYAAIIYLPFILIGLVYLYKDFIKKHPKIFLPALVIFILFSLPALQHYTKNESKTRLNAISILTADITLPTSIAEIEQDKQQGIAFSQIIHNRRLVYASALLDNYFDYFNLDYLFVTAKNIRYFYINNVGLFYLIELPFFLYGFYILVRRREKSDLLILGLMIIGPVPAMITLGSPFPHRALLTIFSIQLISAIGITNFLKNIIAKSNRHSRESGNLETGFSIKSRMTKVSSRQVYLERSQETRTIIVSLFVVYGASVYFFLHQYFVHAPHEFASENDNGAWFSTVRDAIPRVNQYKDNYDKVVFTWSKGKLVPAVYYLFNNQVDPKILQAKATKWTNEPPSFKQVYNQIDNIEFRKIYWEQDRSLKNILLIGYPSEFPEDIEVIDKTYLPNGEPHFVFVETQ